MYIYCTTLGSYIETPRIGSYIEVWICIVIIVLILVSIFYIFLITCQNSSFKQLCNVSSRVYRRLGPSVLYKREPLWVV